MLTSIYQGGLPHLQISRILLLHHTPLQRKNDNNKNNKQKQTHQHTKVRLCHVLDDRPFPLVLALMRIKCRGFSLECWGGGGKRVSSVGGIETSEAPQFPSFSFLLVLEPVCSCYLAKSVSHSFWSPKGMQLTDSNKPINLFKSWKLEIKE